MYEGSFAKRMVMIFVNVYHIKANTHVPFPFGLWKESKEF